MPKLSEETQRAGGLIRRPSELPDLPPNTWVAVDTETSVDRQTLV